MATKKTEVKSETAEQLLEQPEEKQEKKTVDPWDEQVAVIVLSQLSQKVELRDDKKPILQDIREAGPNFSSFVDDVRLLFRADYYHIANKNSHNICEILSTECRHNDLGDLHLPFSEMTLSLSVHKNIQKQADIAQLRDDDHVAHTAHERGHLRGDKLRGDAEQPLGGGAGCVDGVGGGRFETVEGVVEVE